MLLVLDRVQQPHGVVARANAPHAVRLLRLVIVGLAQGLLAGAGGRPPVQKQVFGDASFLRGLNVRLACVRGGRAALKGRVHLFQALDRWFRAF